MVLATSWSRGRIVALMLLPAIFFSGQYLVGDLMAATRTSAQASYFDGLARELAVQPGLRNHRVEVVDTPTHRASAQLAGQLYLARGWEVQEDRAANPLFFDAAPLTPAGYRRWLDRLAVGWVAVPDELAHNSIDEAALVATGLPFLHEAWHDRHWTLYAVERPQQIVPAPARLDSAGPASMTLSVTHPTTVVVRIRPSRYLTIKGGAITRNDSTSVRITLPKPGTYRIAGA